MSKILTAKEYFASKGHNLECFTPTPEDVQAYAEYYAREMAAKFVNQLYEIEAISCKVPLAVDKVIDFYDQFLTTKER